MLRSLKHTALSRYDYRETKELCSQDAFPLVFDCEWGLWRDKAVADFGISEQFFDLVRSLTGPQRYLQISTYERLTEDSLARSVDEGVYEAVAGFKEAVLRGDYDMVLFFYHNLTREQKKYILEEWRFIFENLDREYPAFKQAKKLIRFGLVKPVEDNDYLLLEKGSQEAFHRLYQDEKRKDANYPQRMDFLYAVLASGRLDFIDVILHDYFVLPQGFSITRDIPYVPFWGYSGDILYKLPSQGHIHEIEVAQIVEACLVGCNSRVVDFFRSMFINYVEDNEVAVPQLLQRGMRIQALYPRIAKAEEAYNISKRFPDLPFNYDFMSEFLLDVVRDSLDKPDPDYFTDVVLENDGNLTLITSILPYFDKEEVERHLERIGSKVYPLEYHLTTR